MNRGTYGVWTQDHNEMPKTLTFDELISSEGYHDYVERHGLWHVILNNGCFYTQDRDNPEIGRLCKPIEMLDKNLLHN